MQAAAGARLIASVAELSATIAQPGRGPPPAGPAPAPVAHLAAPPEPTAQQYLNASVSKPPPAAAALWKPAAAPPKQASGATPSSSVAPFPEAALPMALRKAPCTNDADRSRQYMLIYIYTYI